MREMQILCDQCGKRLNETNHIVLNLREGSGISDGNIDISEDKTYDKEEGIKSQIERLKRMEEIDRYPTPYKIKNAQWYVESFRGINNELAFCDSKCLAKFFENKENEMKLSKLAK